MRRAMPGAGAASQETCRSKGVQPTLAGRFSRWPCTEVVLATATVKTHAAASDRMAAALIALVLGSFLVFGAGLANSEVLHNAAHDTRHSYGFPCH